MEDEKQVINLDDKSNEDDELDLEDFFSDDDEEEKVEKSSTEDDKSKESENESDKTNDEDGNDKNEDTKKVQTKEERAHFAKLKREQKQREQEKAEADRQAELKRVKEEATLTAELGVIKENPYTKTPIVDKYDLETFKMMAEIAKNGGDPVKDLPVYLSKQARDIGSKKEEESKKALEEQKKADEHKKTVREDVNRGFNEIRTKYGVNTKELTKDEDFLAVVNELEVLDGRNTVETAYIVYLSRKNSAKEEEGNKEDEDNINKEANRVVKAPSSQTIGKAGNSVLDMTDEEYIALQQKNNGDFF